jgi:hypothetical protein
MKLLKLYIGTVLILGLMFSLIIWFFIYMGSPPLIQNEDSTIGTIIKFQSAGKSGSEAVFQYFVDDKEYEATERSAAYFANVIGEKFEIKYDKNKPSNSFVVSCKPVFLENEYSFIVNGEITRLYSSSWGGGVKPSSYSIEFEFFIGDEKIIKAQRLPPDYQTQFPNLMEGQFYEVEYWLENPQRAIIHLDKPIQ